MAATSPQASSSTSPGASGASALPPVGDADGVARLSFAKRSSEDDDYLEIPPWEFPSNDADPEVDRTESAVCRNVKPSVDEVHQLGCQIEAAARAANRDRRYLGCLESTAGTIRSKKTTKGHGFDVRRYTKEGDWHLHIKVLIAHGMAYGKHDKSDVRALMREAFPTLISHSCGAA